jgi:hypothetical protein
VRFDELCDDPENVRPVSENLVRLPAFRGREGPGDRSDVPSAIRGVGDRCEGAALLRGLDDDYRFAEAHDDLLRPGKCYASAFRGRVPRRARRRPLRARTGYR